ncbi:MAG: hypothetical protein CMJ32_06860 [Phycisphaerae bacterium]|nr:hypothetical protein [Phycisphaerae bacterium]
MDLKLNDSNPSLSEMDGLPRSNWRWRLFAFSFVQLVMCGSWYLVIYAQNARIEFDEVSHWLLLAACGLSLGLACLFGVTSLFLRGRDDIREQMGMGLVVVTSLLVLVTAAWLSYTNQDLSLQSLNPFEQWGIFFLLLVALGALLLPLSLFQLAAWSGLVLIVAAAAYLFVPIQQRDVFSRIIESLASPALLLPGLAICHVRARLRTRQREQTNISSRLSNINSEFSRARIVHDAMFPSPISGRIGFQYLYEPIAEIGGDYIHAYECPDTGKVTVTLLDVAGHGLAAALTVNRLFGELQRIRGEHPDAGPQLIMSLLNRYIHLTMAPHSLYATGACLRLDPDNGMLERVVAGHPPPYLRHASGSVEELTCTAVLLGALDSDEFDSTPAVTHIKPGDMIIMYTDGVFEARNPQGECFGLDRLKETIQFDPPPRDWLRFISNILARHHEGGADDDYLVATLTYMHRFKESARRQAPEITVADQARDRLGEKLQRLSRD